MLIAACIVVPQIIVAAVSPWVGRQAQIWGRRPFLLLGIRRAADARAAVRDGDRSGLSLVAVQVLDGITAAALGVMVPLMVADITRGTGRFNLAQGIVGTAVGIGASISPTLAAISADQFGSQRRVPRACGIAARPGPAWRLIMPETRKPPRPATL